MAITLPNLNPAKSSANQFMAGLPNTVPNTGAGFGQMEANMKTPGDIIPAVPKLPKLTEPTGGGIMPPTTSATPLPETPISSPTLPNALPDTQSSIMDSIIPKANASQEFDSKDIASFRDLMSKGIEPERAKSLILQAKGIQKPEESSLLQDIGTSLSKRGSEIMDIAKKGTGIESGLQTGGQIAGGIGDILGQALVHGLKAITPDFIKQGAEDAAKSILSTDVGQSGLQAIKGGMDSYKEWAKNNPNASKDLEAVVNIASLLPIGKGAKIAGEGIAEGAVKTGKAISETPVKIGAKAQQTAYEASTKANRFNAKDIEDFKSITGETPGEWAVSRGVTDVGDKAVEQASQHFEDSIKQADKAFESIDGNFKYTGKGHDMLKTGMEDLEAKLTKELSPELPMLQELMKKYDTEGLTMSETNEFKRMYQNNNKFSYEGGFSSEAKRATNILDKIREWQFKTAGENGLDNIAEINKNTQGWKEYADMLQKKLSRSSGNNQFGITDWISLSGGRPENLAMFLGKKTLETNTVKGKVIKTLGKKTKEPIIKPNEEAILNANIQKKYGLSNNIPGTRSSVGGPSLVKKEVPLQLGPGTGETSAKTVGLKPIKSQTPGALEKTNKAIEKQVGERPGTTKISKKSKKSSNK